MAGPSNRKWICVYFPKDPELVNKDLTCDFHLFYWRINVFEEESLTMSPPPLSAPGQKSSELSSLPQEWSVSPETSRIFHLWLKWTSYVWEPWLWVKSANCLLMLPRSTNALKYRDIPRVLGSVRKSVGLGHSVPSFILQAPTSFFTALVLWTWEAVCSSSIHNQAQDFLKHSFTCFSILIFTLTKIVGCFVSMEMPVIRSRWRSKLL